MVQGNVETRPTFYGVETTPIYGFGIGTFNASLAKLWSPATDLLYSTAFNEFISDSTRTVDITQASDRRNCPPRSQAGNSSSDCVSTFYAPGGIENSVQWVLESNGSAKADVYLASDQQGYVFEFRHGVREQTFDTARECSVYGSELFALALCLKNSEDQAIQARELKGTRHDSAYLTYP